MKVFTKNIRFCLLFMLLKLSCSFIFTISLFSQEKFESKTFCFSITKVETKERIIGNLNVGSNWFLKLGMKGEIRTVTNSKFPKRELETIGKAEVIELSENNSKIVIDLFELKNPEKYVYDGDQFNIELLVPKKQNQSLLDDLVMYNIGMLDLWKQPFFDKLKIFKSDDKISQDTILKKFVQDIRTTAIELKDFIEGEKSFNTGLEKGYYKGRTTYEIMQNTSTKDVISFLKFVRNFPGKYIGKNWKFNEIFATWILNNSPVAQDDLVEKLLEIFGKKDFENLVREFQKDIDDGDFLTYWNLKSEDLSKSGNIEEAYNLNNMCNAIAEILSNKSYIGWVLFSRSKIIEDENKIEDAILVLKKARKIFAEENITRGESFCVNNIAVLLNNNNNYEESLKYYDEALSLKEKIVQSEKSEDAYLSKGLAYYGKSLLLVKMNKSDMAIENYKQAIGCFEKVNTIKAKKNIAEVQNKIGNIYQKTDNFSEALKYFEKAKSLYSELNDIDKELEVINNIAYFYYKKGNYLESLEFYGQTFKIHIANNNKKEAGFSKSNMAQIYWNLGEYLKAIEAHHEAIKLREEAKDRSGAAYSYSKLGFLYNKSGDPNNAFSSFEKALQIYQELDDKDGLANTYNNLGDAYYNVKDYKKSLINYEKSLEIRKQLKTKSDIAEVIYNIAGVYFDDKDYKKSKAFYEECLMIRKEITEKQGQIYCLIKIGYIDKFIEANPNSIAESYFSEALKIANETENKSDIAYCYRYLRWIYDSKGDNVKVMEYLNKSLNIYKEIGERSNEAEVLIDIGANYISKGEFVKAREFYEKGYKIADSLNNRIILSNALTAIGELNLLEGDFQEAIKIQEKSLKICEEVQNNWGKAGAIISLGNIYNRIGEYQKAIAFYEKADSIYSKIGIESNRATCINNIGTIYYWQGDYNNALVQFNKVEEILTKLNSYSEFYALVKSNIGEVYFELKKYDESEKYLKEAKGIAEKIELNRLKSSIYTTYGKLNISQKKYDDAKNNLTAAYKLVKAMNEKDKICEVSLLLGNLNYELKNKDECDKYLNESINLAKKIDYNKYLYEALYIQSLVAKDKNDIKTCINCLKEAASVLENIQGKMVGGENAKKLFSKGETKIKIFETLISTLIMSSDIDGALEYLEKSNNDGLKTQFGNLDIKFKDENKNRSLEQEKTMKIKVDGVKEQLSKEKIKPENLQNKSKIEALERTKTIAEGDYTKFINEAVRNQPDLANHFRKNVNPIELRKVKRQIPKDLAVVSYLMGENQLYIFVATSDSVIAKVVEIKKDALESKINLFYSMIKSPLTEKRLNTRTLQTETTEKKESIEPTVRSYKKLSEELYDILVSNIKNEIASKNKIAIIPNGELHYIPFQVLGKTQQDSSFKFLGAEKTLFYISSLNIFFSQKSEKAENLKILAFGNADNSLPNAEIEVKDLKSLYPDAVVFIRDKATKDLVVNMPQSFNTLHFATHGNLDYSNFQNSFLTLAPNKEKGLNGKLTLEEIWQITNLYDCKLVTLSACNTAVGGETIQGWLVNPASAFLDAGVQTVIASLWQVNDAATSLLMKEFYNNVKTMDKITALKKAQEVLMNNPKYVDPYYWAGFILVGDWR